MDTEDFQIIIEQIKLLQSNQEILHHAIKHHLKAVNATIGHLELENINSYCCKRAIQRDKELIKTWRGIETG